MTDEDVTAAINVIAFGIVGRACLYGVETLWEDYSEIGEDDWFRIEAKVKDIGHNFAVDADNVIAAYQLLASRAEH